MIIAFLQLAKTDIYTPYYQQARSIARAMTVKQKIGQIIQADFTLITQKNVTDSKLAEEYFLGSLLIGGDGVPNSQGNLIDLDRVGYLGQIKAYMNATMANWKKMSSKFSNGLTLNLQDKRSVNVKYLLGTDAVHNNQHVLGTILFPHNLGLSNSHNPAHFYNLGKWTAKNVKESGFNFVFGPTVAVTHNPQWGRTYQSMGTQPQYIYQYAKEFTRGLQDVQNGRINGVVGSVKHFFGEGATMFGADQGNAWVYNYSSFLQRNIKGYRGAIEEQIGTVMCSYSAVNGIPHSINYFGLQGILRDQEGFKGFVISDYDQIGRITDNTLPTSYFSLNNRTLSVVQILNAGVDMLMLPGYIKGQIKNVIMNIQNALAVGLINMDRIQQAVTRILAVKMAMGLVSVSAGLPHQYFRVQNDRSLSDLQVQQDQYANALKAAQESMVLLKNQNNLLPLDWKKIKNVIFVGDQVRYINRQPEPELFLNYDNIGMQCGGWSVRWQGFMGNYFWSDNYKNQSRASSLLDAVKSRNLTVIMPQYKSFSDVPLIEQDRQKFKLKLRQIRKDLTAQNSVIIGVLGESPYAEFAGDINIPYCHSQVTNNSGCLWFPNQYMGDQQSKTTQLAYDSFASDCITILKQGKKDIPLITVLFSGRPNLVEKQLNKSQAFIAAFWPGTAGGQAVLSAVQGSYKFRPKGFSDTVNKLSFDWPKTMASLQIFPIYWANGTQPRVQSPLLLRGSGLSS